MKYENNILEIINGSTEHLTAEQIFFRMKEQYPSVVMATVYNNLNRLYQQDKIRKIHMEDGADRYDSKQIRHDHLICVKCGRIEDIALPDLTEKLEEQARLRVLGYDLKIRYLCPECQKEDSPRREAYGDSSDQTWLY